VEVFAVVVSTVNRSVPQLGNSHSRRALTKMHASDGRCVGWIRDFHGRRAIVKPVSPARHMLSRPPAWALDLEAIEQGERLDVRLVVLLETIARIWIARLEQFRGPMSFPMDRGHGAQRALPLKEWACGWRADLVLAQAEAVSIVPAPAAVVVPAIPTAQQIGLELVGGRA